MPGAELDLLKQLEDARDLMADTLKKTSADRSQLEEVFGGDCIRIRKIRDTLEILDERPLSEMNRNDQRLKHAHDTCDSVIKVLEDMGYGWLLRSRVNYADQEGQLFQGNAFTVGQPIKPIKPRDAKASDFQQFLCAPALPAGLSIDESTGEISGTPQSEAPPTEYTVTCIGTGKPVHCKLLITVNPKPVIPPGIDGFTYSPSTQKITVDKDMSPWEPQLRGGDAPESFSILPSLPDGLGINPATGVITGNPVTFFDLAPFTVSAKNKGGVTHCKIGLEVVPDHQGDLVGRIIACTEPEQLVEFEAIVMEEKNAKKPFNWMIWMVHRAHLNDPTLKKFDFTNARMPTGLEEPLISPKLMVAVATNDQIDELLLASSNLQNHEAAVLACSLRENTVLRVLNIDSNQLRPLELESLAHGIGDNKALAEFRCNNCASGRQVFEALAHMVKSNTFITKIGFSITDPHFRGQIDGQLTRNNDAARKRRVAAKKAAEAEAAAAAAAAT